MSEPSKPQPPLDDPKPLSPLSTDEAEIIALIRSLPEDRRAEIVRVIRAQAKEGGI